MSEEERNVIIVSASKGADSERTWVLREPDRGSTQKIQT